MLLSMRLVPWKHFSCSRQVMSPLKCLTFSTDTFEPNLIYGKENRDNCIACLKQVKMPIKKTPTTRKAAVLVPLCIINGEASILYTVRSQSLATHRGQVSFPGGMMDESDVDITHTAMREAEEELGISQADVDVWTVCNYVNTRNNIIVAPVVGSIHDINIDELVVNPKEVSSVFTLSLRHLCNPAFFRYTQFRNRITPAFLGCEHRVWGLTAGITHFVMRCLVPAMYRNQVTLIKPISKASVL